MNKDWLLTAADAQRCLGIPASTVRTWHQRRARTGLYPVGLDRSGRPLFHEADLIALKSGRPVRDDAGDRALAQVMDV